MAISHLILSDLVPDGLRQRLIDCAETYRFTPPDPRGGGAFAMSRMASAGTAAIRELVEWLSPRWSGLPGLRSFAPNEASFQRYEAGGNGLAPHRDQRYYVNAIAILTLLGQARFAVLGSADPLDIVEEWETQPGEVVMLAGWTPHSTTDVRPYHRVDAPQHGHRLMLQLRQNDRGHQPPRHRPRLAADDVVVTTVVEHHANLLLWARLCRRRFVECGSDGTVTVDDVVRGLQATPRPKLLAVTSASNVTGWLPPIDDIITAAHERDVPVLVDAAQLAPHRPLPADADFVAWSGHKMYAPFGAGVLIGPRAVFSEGDPFLAGGGAVDLVDLDEVAWTDPPDREEAGSPNVIGAVALHAAIDELGEIGWDVVIDHDTELQRQLRAGLAAVPGVVVLGPDAAGATLPLVTFTVTGVPHALAAARLSAEHAIGVRHRCFCAHPYLVRLLGLGPDGARHWGAVRHGDRRAMPGALRASAGLSTSVEDLDRLVTAVADIASGRPPPVTYHQDPRTGDFHVEDRVSGWPRRNCTVGASCARG